MNTCNTCKWWVSRGKEVSFFGKCSNPKVNEYRLSDWNLSEDGISFDSACPESAESFAQDEPEKQFFTTGPKFGCIHHEGR